MRSTFSIGIGVWIFLFALFLPFSYPFFPNAGIELTNSFAGVTEWLASKCGATLCVSPATSDSSAQFAQSQLLLIFALTFAVVLRNQKRFSELQIKQFLNTAAAHILSFFLLKYGIDKLFQYQFYAPEPNTLFTPLGMLSKDILFWSSMGTSAGYNTFMGLLEVIPALLLLHHRTRLLGGLFAFGVLVNVLAINFSFDITVKLLSMFLVIVAIYVIAPSLKKLYAFFISNSVVGEQAKIRLVLSSKARLMVKSIVVVLLFTEVLFSYVEIGSMNGRTREKIAHFGSYEASTPDSAILGVKNVKRIHVHSKGYLILEDENGHFTDFAIRIAPDQSILVRKKNARIFVVKNGTKAEFDLREKGRNLKIITRKIDLDALPARDDSFHWTVDGLISDEK